ncbi:MAG: hypothetical protein WB643_04610 [Candidatus Bathyarchaeia archaeon]
MKDSFGSKVENENSGNMRSFSVQLPANVADWMGKAALRKDKTAEQFLRELIITSVEEEAKPLTLRLQRLDELVKKMQVTVKKTPMQEEKDAKTGVHSLEERTKRREHLIELGLEAYDELKKIAASEQASKKSEARLQAFAVMARIGTFNAAVIRDAENDELGSLLAEVESTDAELKQELERLQKKRREEEERGRY